MKKLLFIILMITSLFYLSCNHNKVLSPSYIGKVGEIEVNPYKLAPLSAVYRTEAVNGVPITVTVKGLYGEPDIIHTYPAGYGTEFEIHGMFPESMNTIEVNDGERIITKNVSIGALSVNGEVLPSKFAVEINNLPEEKYPNNPDLYYNVITMNFSSFYTVGVSRNGYVRYFYNDLAPKLRINNKQLVLSGYLDRNLSGKYLIDKRRDMHHDVIKINNNHLYLSHSQYGTEDRLSKTDLDGNNLVEMKFGQLIEKTLDLNRYKEDEAMFKRIAFGEDVNNIYLENGQEKTIDWFHANSIVYDSATDILYVSSRHRGVLAIDYSEWKLIWWMADKNIDVMIGTGYGYIPYDNHLSDLRSLEDYRVKGAGMDDGPKNQHALFLLANGNLGMFDNQGDENINPNGSRYVEYKITGTHGNYTAQKVYEYRNTSLFSRTMSDVDFTGENYENLLLCYGNGQVVLEIDKLSKKELFKLKTSPFHMYRSDKMPLYYDEGRIYSEDCNLKNPN